MRGIRQADTRPEMAVRRALYAGGMRYRIHFRIPGVRSRPDIVFLKLRLAVYIDGCFWHGCPRHGSSATRNGAAWSAKIAENRVR